MKSGPDFMGRTTTMEEVKGGVICALFWLSCALVSTPLMAQQPGSIPAGGWTPPSGTSSDAIVVGPFLFSPALQLTWQDRDNIFYTPDNEVSDQVYLVRGQLLFELPVNESHIYFSYSPQYTDYRTYELQDKWSHYFDLGGSFLFSNGLAVRARYNYIIGNLETRLVDPGGELYYGDPRFIKNYAEVAADYWFTNRDGLFVDFSWTDLDHSDPQLFYDYTSLAAGIGWLHQLSPNLVMDARYGVIDFQAHDAPNHSNSFRDSLSNVYTLGFRGQLSPVVATEGRVGYQTIHYDLQPGDPPIDDFSGFIVNGLISWDMAHGSVLSFDVLHAPFPSNYADNANYVATGAGLTYSLDRGSVYGQAHGRFQNNEYDLPDPVTEELRSDDILSLGLGLGVRFGDHMSLFGSYLFEDRESLYRYSYTINIYTLGLVLGF